MSAPHLTSLSVDLSYSAFCISPPCLAALAMGKNAMAARDRAVVAWMGMVPVDAAAVTGKGLRGLEATTRRRVSYGRAEFGGGDRRG